MFSSSGFTAEGKCIRASMVRRGEEEEGGKSLFLDFFFPVVQVVAFSSPTLSFFDDSITACAFFFFFFLKWGSARAHRFHSLELGSVHSGSASRDDCGRAFAVPEDSCVSSFPR